MEAKQFLGTADDDTRTKFSTLFARLADIGKISNKEQFRKLRDDIWEAKRNGYRILCFQRGRRWLLTHVYKKQKRKCPPGEIDRAEQIMLEHMQLEDETT